MGMRKQREPPGDDPVNISSALLVPYPYITYITTDFSLQLTITMCVYFSSELALGLSNLWGALFVAPTQLAPVSSPTICFNTLQFRK